MDDPTTPTVKSKTRKPRGKTPGPGPTSKSGNGTGTNLPTDSGTGPDPESSDRSRPADALPLQTETIGVGVHTSDKVNPLLTGELAAEIGLDVSQSSLILVSIFDGLAALLFGDAARMNPTERALISEPLERILKRLSPDITKQVSTWGDYAMLIMGLIAWGSRIARLQADKAKQAKTESPPPPNKPESPPPPPTGPASDVLPIGEITAAPVTILAEFGGNGL